jgi:hypothetical protein
VQLKRFSLCTQDASVNVPKSTVKEAADKEGFDEVCLQSLTQFLGLSAG